MRELTSRCSRHVLRTAGRPSPLSLSHWPCCSDVQKALDISQPHGGCVCPSPTKSVENPFSFASLLKGFLRTLRQFSGVLPGRVILTPKWTSGRVSVDCYIQGEVRLASSGWRPGMLVGSFTPHPPTASPIALQISISRHV